MRTIPNNQRDQRPKQRPREGRGVAPRRVAGGAEAREVRNVVVERSVPASRPGPRASRASPSPRRRRTSSTGRRRRLARRRRRRRVVRPARLVGSDALAPLGRGGGVRDRPTPGRPTRRARPLHQIPRAAARLRRAGDPLAPRSGRSSLPSRRTGAAAGSRETSAVRCRT